MQTGSKQERRGCDLEGKAIQEPGVFNGKGSAGERQVEHLQVHVSSSAVSQRAKVR